ncbi:hypothetical protein ADK67_32590 [Saccharothrix sp. NRRL B-16348]|nr:hypothetical protein ADK67_32590 [Saccharothrix sp. NRRL B-16348]
MDAVEPQIRRLLEQWPTMPTTVTAERIGWTSSMTDSRTGCESCGRLFALPDRLADGLRAG